MGAGASRAIEIGVVAASQDDLNGAISDIPADLQLKLKAALGAPPAAALRGEACVEDVFAAFHGRSGRLTYDELVRATGQVGRSLSRFRVQYLLQKFDASGSGTLDLGGFKALLSYLQRGHNVQDELAAAWELVDSLKADNVGLERQAESAREEAASLRRRMDELEVKCEDPHRRVESAEGETASSRPRANEGPRAPGSAPAPAKTSLADLVKEARAQADSASHAHTQHCKFAEETFTLAYTGRSAFFGGLESLIGLPTPNLRIAMEAEHCASADSQYKFTANNYGITTTPEVEWHAVLDPEAGLKALSRREYLSETFGLADENHRGLKALSRREYPSETFGLADENHRRKLKPLEHFLPALEKTNKSLIELKEPTVCEEELIAGRLYTGPMVRVPLSVPLILSLFSLSRSLSLSHTHPRTYTRTHARTRTHTQTTHTHTPLTPHTLTHTLSFLCACFPLRNTLASLPAYPSSPHSHLPITPALLQPYPHHTYHHGAQFQKYNLVCRASIEEAPTITKENFEASCKGNCYRTTLHSLNSTVVKCSKLTKATKVYRGSARGVLPPSFWKADENGVRGGVEAGFMSTSRSREVAIGYAGLASEGKTPMVFEMAQGMINRGAELSWLSQYPHEEEGEGGIHQPYTNKDASPACASAASAGC